MRINSSSPILFSRYWVISVGPGVMSVPGIFVSVVSSFPVISPWSLAFWRSLSSNIYSELKSVIGRHTGGRRISAPIVVTIGISGEHRHAFIV